MEQTEKSFKEIVFDLMNGYYDLDCYTGLVPEGVDNEFESDYSLCQLWYENVYQAKNRLCSRLNKNEDRDVEIIINSLLDMGKYQSLKMFDYGVHFASKQKI